MTSSLAGEEISGPVKFFQNCFFYFILVDILILHIYFFMMKFNDSRGDSTNISAKKASLLLSMHRISKTASQSYSQNAIC